MKYEVKNIVAEGVYPHTGGFLSYCMEKIENLQGKVTKGNVQILSFYDVDDACNAAALFIDKISSPVKHIIGLEVNQKYFERRGWSNIVFATVIDEILEVAEKLGINTCVNDPSFETNGWKYLYGVMINRNWLNHYVDKESRTHVYAKTKAENEYSSKIKLYFCQDKNIITVANVLGSPIALVQIYPESKQLNIETLDISFDKNVIERLLQSYLHNRNMEEEYYDYNFTVPIKSTTFPAGQNFIRTFH